MTDDGEDPEITHVVMGEGWVGAPALPERLRRQLGWRISKVGSQEAGDSDEDNSPPPPRPGAPALVDVSWLEQSLLHQCVQKERNFPPQPAPHTSTVDPEMTKASKSQCHSSMEHHHLKAWAGEYWHDDCADMSLTELALQVVYNEERSRKIGNEGVVKALADLARYERSLHQDYFEDAGTGEEMINHRVSC